MNVYCHVIVEIILAVFYGLFLPCSNPVAKIRLISFGYLGFNVMNLNQGLVLIDYLLIIKMPLGEKNWQKKIKSNSDGPTVFLEI